MLQNRINGLPVIDATGKLVGIVTEGDFLRRGEIGTQRHLWAGSRSVRTGGTHLPEMNPTGVQFSQVCRGVWPRDTYPGRRDSAAMPSA